MSMEVKIELGHKAWKNLKPTIEGHTHDWSVFVQGVNGNEIKHIVEKVIFHLPDAYPDPKQIRETPPFVVSDSTSGSFSMTIDVFFCAGAELNKVCYIYDVSISNEEINSSWEERVIFSNPSQAIKEKLLLAGGKEVDTQKTLNCKVEPDDENIQSMDSEEALVVKKIDDLQELLKENENLKAANQKVKEKADLQEKLISSYIEKLASCETNILKTRMGIRQLQKKMESGENEISTLKLQVQMLQNELSQMKNPPKKNPEKNLKEKEEIKNPPTNNHEKTLKGRKRKIKENLNVSAPVVKKSGPVIQPSKIMPSPVVDVPSTLQSSLSKDFSVSVKEQNFRGRVTRKKSITTVQNSSTSKTDASINDSSNIISGPHFSSSSSNETKLVNGDTSNQQTMGGDSNLGTLNHQLNVSCKSTNACDKGKLVKRRLIRGKHSQNILEIANTNFEKPGKESSIKSKASAIKSKLRNSDCENSTDQGLMEVAASLDIPKKRKLEVEKSVEGSSIEAIPAVIKLELRNNGFKKPTNQGLMKIASSLDIPQKRKVVVKKPVEGSSIDANAAVTKSYLGNNIPQKSKEVVEKPVEGSSIESNAAVIKSELRNSDSEKPTYPGLIIIASSLDIPQKSKVVEKPVEGSLLEANDAVVKSKLGDNDCEKNTDKGLMKITSLDIPKNNKEVVEKPVEGSSIQANAAENNPIIRKSDVEKHSRMNDAESFMREKSAEVNVLVKESEARNIDEKNEKGISIEVTPSLNNFETTTNDDAMNPIEKRSNESSNAINNDTVKFIEESSREDHNAFSKCSVTCTMDSVEQVDRPSKKRHVSSIQIASKNPFLLNGKVNGQKLTSSVADEISSVASSNTDSKNRQNPISKTGYLSKLRNNFQNANLNHSTACRNSPQDMNRNQGQTLMGFMSNHWEELVIELDRIRNSEFGKFRHKTNPLFYKLGNIDKDISDKYFGRYIRSITDFFTSIKTAFDLATIVYFVVGYLSCRTNYPSFPAYIQNQITNMSLPNSENCIISVLCEVERLSLPHLKGLIRITLNIIHRVIVSKKRMAANGLASLCRVFMDLCRRRNERLEPLFLCCELLRLGHPLAPYLINCLAAVWRNPFFLHNEFSVEERILLGSIVYGMKEKPLLMNSNLWNLTCRLTSTHFPQPIIVDSYEAMQFLTAKIFSRCNEGLFENFWISTSPLYIFILNKSWDAKIYFGNEYVVPNLLHFARRPNEKAFNFFCNLYVDICSFCHESPFEELLKYFNRTPISEGKKFVQDCAAVAMLKYVITTDRHIPAPLSAWLLRNKNNPKLQIIVDLYCKKVMQSQDNLLLYDDIILL